MKITKLKVCLFLSALFVLAAASLEAQSGLQLRLHVPFDFIAGGMKLPAGDYVIEESGPAGLLLIEGRGPNRTAAVLSSAAFRGQNAEPGATFRRVGDSVYLSTVQLLGEPSRQVNLPSKIVAASLPVH